MIPELTLEALTMGFGHLGSVNADKKPSHTDTFSASFDHDKDTVTCFVLSSLAGSVLENFKATGRVSYFFGLPSHEAYQFKGQFIGTRELVETELAQSEKFRKYIKEMMSNMGITTEAFEQSFGMTPDLGLTFKVEKIFKQTPGPEAGKELNFN